MVVQAIACVAKHPRDALAPRDHSVAKSDRAPGDPLSIKAIVSRHALSAR